MRTTRFIPIALLLLFALTLAACADETAEPDLAEQDTTAMQDTTAAGVAGNVARLGVVEQEPYGAFLADVDGRALYMFTADAQGDSSACYDACADAWPPLVSGQEPIATAPRLEADMLDRIERRDGSMQVTYNGWPLYYYQQDAGAGEVTGQDVHGFGGEWYLVSPEGEQIEETRDGSAS